MSGKKEGGHGGRLQPPRPILAARVKYLGLFTLPPLSNRINKTSVTLVYGWYALASHSVEYSVSFYLSLFCV